MTPPREEWRLGTRHVGRRTLLYDRLDSTSTLAAELAADRGNDGLAVLADEQTAGRGQYGRSWQCPAGSGVLLSVLLFPPPELRRPAVLTAWAAVAVCSTVHKEAGLPPRIKWPNDVLVRGRKVCGILIEQGQGTIVGIGLNVNQPAEAFTRAGLPQAASLAVFTGERYDCRQVARRLIEQLDVDYHRLRRGNLGTLEGRWRRRLRLLDKDVLAECPEASYRGRLREIGWEGVVLELPDGETLRLPPEAVRHLHPTRA